MRNVLEQLNRARPVVVAENRYLQTGPLQTRNVVYKGAFPTESGFDLQTEYPGVELDLRVEVTNDYPRVTEPGVH